MAAITLVLIFFSESLHLPAIGVIAAVLLALLGLWLLVDGLQYQDGQTVNQLTTCLDNQLDCAFDRNNTLQCNPLMQGQAEIPANDTGTCCCTNILMQEVDLPNYIDVPSPPGISIQNLLGLMFVLLAIFYGGWNVTRVWGGR